MIIRLYWKKNKKYGYTFLYKILLEELDIIKCYLDLYLAKEFIKANSILYLLFIFFVKKLKKKISYCVDYWKLNAIIKKNRYFIFFIEEILA